MMIALVQFNACVNNPDVLTQDKENEISEISELFGNKQITVENNILVFQTQEVFNKIISDFSHTNSEAVELLNLHFPNFSSLDKKMKSFDSNTLENLLENQRFDIINKYFVTKELENEEKELVPIVDMQTLRIVLNENRVCKIGDLVYYVDQEKAIAISQDDYNSSANGRVDINSIQPLKEFPRLVEQGRSVVASCSEKYRRNSRMYRGGIVYGGYPGYVLSVEAITRNFRRRLLGAYWAQSNTDELAYRGTITHFFRLNNGTITTPETLPFSGINFNVNTVSEIIATCALCQQIDFTGSSNHSIRNGRDRFDCDINF